MIRYGEWEDLTQIDIFDIFGGDRQQEILERRLQVYTLENKVVGKGNDLTGNRE